MRRTSRSLALAGLLAGALVLTACGGGDDPTGGGGEGSSSATRAQFNDADVEFASGMVPHHEQAVQMAAMILTKDPSQPVRALAERIQAAQEPEIEELNALLQSIGEEPAGGGHGGHGGADAEGHGGMMTDEQMQDLQGARGVDAERMFLTLMIEHHRGAVESAETVIADGESQATIELATRIRDDQRAEIAEMEQLLADL